MSKGVYFANIEKLTKDNEKYRKVLNTNSHLQLVLMSIPPKENIPKETHNDVDQFFKIESGKGKAIVDGKQYPLFEGTALIVPANTQHEIINTGNKPLKIYTIYAPPEHPFNRVDENKPMEGGSNFKTKYQKYKLKYLSLKNQQQGGAMHRSP